MNTSEQNTDKAVRDMGRKRNGPFRRAKFVIDRKALSGFLIALVAYITLTVILSLALAPEQYDLRAGDIAAKTIVATKDVIDEYTTAINRDSAASAVQPTYSEREGLKDEALEKLERIFGELEQARSYGEALKRGTGPMAAPSAESSRPPITQSPGAVTRDQYEYAASMIHDFSMSTWQMTILFNLSEAELVFVRDQVYTAVRGVMEGTIVESQVNGIVNSIQREFLNNMSSDVCFNIAIPVVRQCVMPNMVVNQQATEQERERARNDVEPTYYKQGQNIVTAGSRVTEQQIAIMASLGLLSGNAFDTVLIGGVALLVALIIALFGLHLFVFDRTTLRQPKLLMLMLVITLISVGLSFALQSVSPYLAPLSVGALLAVSTLPGALSWMFNIAIAILAGFVAKGSGAFSQQMMHVVVHGIMGGALGIYVLTNHPKRLTVMLAGLYIAVFNLISMFALGFITNNNMASILRDALYSFAGGLLAAILAMGIQPALEWMFNLVTPAKLMELANPNHPLLRRLMLEAPGTYQHSLMVANLGEAAANEIGANALLVRVGSYYHDIGKLARPQFFKENQLSENPHDKLDPFESAQLVIRHVSEGATLAQKYRLPAVLRDLISQHHGDTPTVYFYNQAIKLNPSADLAQFRYREARPKTTEAAILLLADSVEAAIRSMPDHSGEKIEQCIKVIIQQKMADGQLDDAPIRFKDLSLICKAFAQALNGLYHQRIEYPNFDLRKEALIPDKNILLIKHGSQKTAADNPGKGDADTKAAPPQHVQPAEQDKPGAERTAPAGTSTGTSANTNEEGDA